MRTIQIVLEEDLLKAVNDKEVADRAGYLSVPEGDEMAAFEKVMAWPED